MPTLPAWMNHPAMLWDTSSGEKEAKDATCVYWSDSRNSWISETSQPTTSVTYRELFGTAATSALYLKQQYLDDIQSSSGIIPIVVAIPEGPWLPLAVLVVHGLNQRLGQQETGPSPPPVVMVPLEPSEAVERNRRILQDIDPYLVLGVGGCNDFETLESLLVTTTTARGNDGRNPCQLVDFSALVQEACKLHHPLSSFDNFCSTIPDLDCTNLWTLQDWIMYPVHYWAGLSSSSPSNAEPFKCNRISHIVYTSGTTGQPKGCVSSIFSLRHYFKVKNQVYNINSGSTVLLASALSFDPCLSDILATFQARAQLALVPRKGLLLDQLVTMIQQLQVTHILCTPTLWSMVHSSKSDKSLSSLQIVALGGEPIPKLLAQRWARSEPDQPGCRLLATYGVTEACVYQTAGEILLSEKDKIFSQEGGQYVGAPFDGLHIRICDESRQDSLEDMEAGQVGEVVLYGSQLDSLTGYWKRPELAWKFVAEEHASKDGSKTMRYHYRTGDRGILHPVDGSLRILGRIDGEEGMVKVNGVRIELGEIEAAIVDHFSSQNGNLSEPPAVVENAVVRVLQDGEDSSTRSEVHAFCVISEHAAKDLGFPSKTEIPTTGTMVTGGTLLTLLRARCTNSLKAACIPNAFVLLPSLPLSPTGKRDRRGLPSLSECQRLGQGAEGEVLLKDYGKLGEFMAGIISESLNLQPLQQEMLTTTVTLDMLGGDSLVATRLIRALYAFHHQVDNTRYLGGDYGKFEGPFDVVHLMRAKSLGDYVDMLERNGVGTSSPLSGTGSEKVETKKDAGETIEAKTDSEADDIADIKSKPRNQLYDALVQATTTGQASIAIALLHAGADPKYGDHGKRLGKVGGGFFYRKFAFHTSPLHLACKQGNAELVEHLLHFGAKCKSPDAAGVYPLHLVASSMDGLESSPEEDARRLECVKLLLNAGAPIVMCDGNHQTILHAAARSGHSSIIRYILKLWKETGNETSNLKPGKRLVNWQDRWYRTGVHWAVLNGRLEALRVLLQEGCSPAPYKPKIGKHTSVAIEYPLELCNRLYPPDIEDEKKRKLGQEMRQLLQDAILNEFSKNDQS